MRQFLQSTLLILGTLLTVGSLDVLAQTPSACGCAFIKGLQPKNVRVQFAGQPMPIRAKADMVVHSGDAIKVTYPVSASMVCDNVTGIVVLQSIPRTQPVKCLDKPKEGILIGRNGRLIDSRTMSDTVFAFPVILSPRSTKVLNPLPLLRWTTINRANSYKVTVRSNEGSWTTTVPAKPNSHTQEMAYPRSCAPNQTRDCAPPLKAGESYKLIVEANGRNSEEEGLPNLGFTVLTAQAARQVWRKTDYIKRLSLSKSLKRYMLASFYANNELNADAIGILERAPESPATLRLLGDLYLKLNLAHRAEAVYLNLLSRNLSAQDTPAGRAITRHSLGEVYEILGNTQEAIKHYEEARRLYRAVKDEDSQKLVESRLSDLRQPLE
jgi:hypothetical protein